MKIGTQIFEQQELYARQTFDKYTNQKTLSFYIIELNANRS